MNSRRILATVLALGWAAAGSPARAESVVLKAVADTSLFSQSPGNSLGASVSIAVGDTAHGQPARSLVRFDLTALPAGAQVTNVSLAFSVTKGPSGGKASSFQAFRMLKSWTEGRGAGNTGSAAKPGETTWNHRVAPTEAWTAPGGAAGTDYASAASGAVAVNALGRYKITGAGLLADVKGWQNASAPNEGWIMISDKEAVTLTARRVATREAGTAAPTLTVDFTPSAVATPPQLIRWGKVNDRFELEFRGEAGNIYEVQFSNAIPPAAPWQVLTNYVVKLISTNLIATDSLDATPGRFYRVADVGDVD